MASLLLFHIRGKQTETIVLFGKLIILIINNYLMKKTLILCSIFASAVLYSCSSRSDDNKNDIPTGMTEAEHDSATPATNVTADSSAMSGHSDEHGNGSTRTSGNSGH